jgi:hypothetical protein
MVTDTEGYIQVIEYLTENLSLFENSMAPENASETVMSTIEVELCEQIITVCSQNQNLSFTQRNAIIREVDSIVYDLEEILSGVINNPVNVSQQHFIREFSSLIKNLFDTVIHDS